MRQSSAGTQEVNTMRATLPQASVLLLGGVVAVLVGPCRSSVTQEPINNDQLSSHTPPSAELIQSVMVNQMTLLRMLNQSSTNCSPVSNKAQRSSTGLEEIGSHCVCFL
ncbi:hypothetical protein E2C01_052526 [Portunus trituberculatus]|uniref:Uncharacterized protein n=1 Tax=Portunus trituberculatus TaxID=210409 RepID=A0A5B7GDZ5_PORTR|nr:hypothetical protein [Portunus trituberculatus]